MSPDKARELAVLLLLVPCCAVAGLALLRAVRARSTPEVAAAAAFALLCLAGLQAWPAAGEPWRYPIACARAAAPALVLAAWWSPPRLADKATRVLAWSAALAVMAYALRIIISYQPAVGDRDFFTYLLTARDQLDRVTASGAAQPVYFPGTYLPWELALAATHRSLPALQWFYTGILLLNGALVGAVVWRATCSPCWTAFCAAAQLLLCIDLGASGGITEPIAILFPLGGILLWNGEPLRGRRGLWLAAFLGAGFGCGIYCKQTAALVALGFGILFLLRTRDATDQLSRLLLVPLCAAATLAGLFGLHGGMTALRGGLHIIDSYKVMNDFSVNVSKPWHVLWPLPWLALGGLLSLVGLLLFRRELSQPWLRRAALLLSAGFWALYQYRTRPFLHYGLLSLPLLLAGTAGLLYVGWTQLRTAAPRAARAAAPALILLATAWLGGRDGDVGLASRPGPLRFFSLSVDRPLLREWPYGFPAQAQLEAIKPLLQPGEGAFVISPMRNAAHFLLGTRSLGWPQGYGWGPPLPGDAERAVADARVRTVIICRSLPNELLEEVSSGAGAAIASLPSHGYRELISTADVAVYRR